MPQIAQALLKKTAGVVIRQVRCCEFAAAAQVLGRGMCDNPEDLRVFQIPDRQRRGQALTRFFGVVLDGLYRRGLVLGAFRGETLVGVCGVARPGFCQPTTIEKLCIVPVVVYGNPLGTTVRMLKWAGDWARRDPPKSHWHLGPVAVDPVFQGQGVGGAMLAAFCASIDQYSAHAYLETDKHRNVRFYRRFGFEVIAQAEVLGVRNWFMSRAPRPLL
jgi:ribosomal protein S18 acetylase RimI-like enzyme